MINIICDANLNRHALRSNKNIRICCEPQSTRFEDLTFINETRTKGINRP